MATAQDIKTFFAAGGRKVTNTQLLRTGPAFSFLNKDGSDASVDQLIDWLWRQVRGKVRQYEQRQLNVVADAQVNSDLQAEGWK